MNGERQRHGYYSVYVVQCTDGTYYTGSTNNLENRPKLHNAGNGAKYLRGRERRNGTVLNSTGSIREAGTVRTAPDVPTAVWVATSLRPQLAVAT